MIMPFVQAKCPMCGGMLAVDDAKKAAVCQFCGDAFVVEEAVNNYITNNITNNTINNNIGDGAIVNVIEQSKSVPALLERVAQFLEDKDWNTAVKYCDDILDIDPKNAQAYLCKLMAEFHAPKKADLAKHRNLGSSVNYQRILKYGDKAMQDELNGYLSDANDKKRNQRNLQKYQESEKQYQDACKAWEEQVSAIQKACETKVNAKLSSEKEGLLADIESKHTPNINELSQQLQTLEQEKSKAEAMLNTLGIFAFSEKKNIKQSISVLTTQIENTKAQLSAEKQAFSDEKEELVHWENDRREQLTTEVMKENPLPPKPEHLPIVLDDGTTVTITQLENQCIMDFILNAMEAEYVYEKNELLEIANKFKKMSIYRLYAIINSMVDRGDLERITEAGTLYFKLR